MSIYAMVDYFKQLRLSNLNVSVKTTQEYAEGLDGSCPWEWILMVGGSELTFPYDLGAVLTLNSPAQDPRQTSRVAARASR